MNRPDEEEQESSRRNVTRSARANPPLPIAPDDADEIQTALVELIHEQESLRKSETLYRDFFQNNKTPFIYTT